MEKSSEKERASENFVQWLMSIRFIGDKITTVIVFFPGAILLVLFSNSAWAIAFAGLLSLLWLLFLQEKYNIQVNTPFIPIPLLLVIPIITIYLLYQAIANSNYISF